MDHSAACDIENGFGRRGTASIKAVGRGLALALVMAGSIAASCGAFAAGAAPHPKLVASDIAGRWTGNHYGYGTQRTKCGDKPCSMTVDISACASGWCGVMVKEDGGCGAAAMTIEASESKHEALRFKGKLELTAGAAPFVIQATLWQASGETKRSMHIIGDTGSELRFMRRSFPLEAELARTGDAICTGQKATS